MLVSFSWIEGANSHQIEFNLERPMSSEFRGDAWEKVVHRGSIQFESFWHWGWKHRLINHDSEVSCLENRSSKSVKHKSREENLQLSIWSIIMVHQGWCLLSNFRLFLKVELSFHSKLNRVFCNNWVLCHLVVKTNIFIQKLFSFCFHHHLIKYLW